MFAKYDVDLSSRRYMPRSQRPEGASHTAGSGYAVHFPFSSVAIVCISDEHTMQVRMANVTIMSTATNDFKRVRRSTNSPESDLDFLTIRSTRVRRTMRSTASALAPEPEEPLLTRKEISM